MDTNLMSFAIINNPGISDGVFCPPEFQESGHNGLSADVKVGCKVAKTNGGSINPLAPIVLFQCPINGCEGRNGKNLGTDPAGRFSYILLLTNLKYQDVYNQMISTFKFVK